MRMLCIKKLANGLKASCIKIGFKLLLQTPKASHRRPTPPLTLDELREMDGDPVWVVQVDGEFRPFWMLVDVEDESASNRLYAAMFEDYGTGWLAYRRKPEEN